MTLGEIERAGRWSLRGRYEGSWIEDFVGQLKALDLGKWTVVFGAELLWSVLPRLIS